MDDSQNKLAGGRKPSTLRMTGYMFNISTGDLFTEVHHILRICSVLHATYLNEAGFKKCCSRYELTKDS